MTDADYCIPCGAGRNEALGDDNFSLVMKACSPACVGEGQFDLRRIDLGLKGDNVTKCGVCNEVMKAEEKDSTILVTLPCFHVFHSRCLGNDIRQCPTCCAAVPDDLSTYRIPYGEQLQRRLDEFPLSGFCTKCMMWNMERVRNTVLGG